MVCELNKECGFWLLDDPNSKEHMFDNKLATSLIDIFKNVSLVDLGCGFGNYVKAFKNAQIVCDGFDGNPYTEQLTNGNCKVLDLSKPIMIEKYDWVLSLEVAEHIPEKFESIYVNNLHKTNRLGIIISWGIPGQPGWGHVNCKNNDYVKSKFNNLGYKNDLDVENKLRMESTFSWFKHSIMVFKK